MFLYHSCEILLTVVELHCPKFSIQNVKNTWAPCFLAPSSTPQPSKNRGFLSLFFAIRLMWMFLFESKLPGSVHFTISLGSLLCVYPHIFQVSLPPFYNTQVSEGSFSRCVCFKERHIVLMYHTSPPGATKAKQYIASAVSSVLKLPLCSKLCVEDYMWYTGFGVFVLADEKY